MTGTIEKVKLVAITRPCIEGVLTPEDFVAYAARVSNPSNQSNSDTSGKLLDYLMRNAHWSPFEMVHLCMEINTTRDIARQILRHRSFSFQEFSQRYAVSAGFSEPREARLQDRKNRQNSIETDDTVLQEWWEEEQIWLLNHVDRVYNEALDKGIAKEQARAVLPEGLTLSRLYMSGTLRSWIHYCKLRMKNGTQKEHMDIAARCWDVIKNEFKSLNLED